MHTYTGSGDAFSPLGLLVYARSICNCSSPSGPVNEIPIILKRWFRNTAEIILHKRLWVVAEEAVKN